MGFRVLDLDCWCFVGCSERGFGWVYGLDLLWVWDSGFWCFV